MNRLVRGLILIAFVTGGLAAAACSAADGRAQAKTEPAVVPPIQVAPVEATERPIARFVRATGSLTAQELAEVAAEIAGRVVSTPVERGTAVDTGSVLIQISPTESDAQVAEAEANAAQIEARLGLTSSAAFDVNKVPEVQNMRAAYDLAESEFNRIQSLLDQRVVSRSEFDQRRTQMEASRQQFEAAKNMAAQQYQQLQAARARVVMAQKALADTVVRAPFAGLVAERRVSVGDYVTKGTKVAVVVRINPLRVLLTVPERFVSAVTEGATVSFEVDAFPDRRFEGKIRYVSPALEANQRALTVEAVVANPGNELKPGLFATARIEQRGQTPGVVVPSSAIQTVAGTSRVFVIVGDHVEERIVTVGQTLEAQVEITNGLKQGERVATKNVAQLSDNRKVS
jgi:membrane fusion protein, multidrug efflux system